jgi:molecular chaperone DnaJ
VLRVAGEGMPFLEGSGSGDLNIRIDVEVPKRLSAEQKRLLQEFAKSMGEDVSSASKTVYERVKDAFA